MTKSSRRLVQAYHLVKMYHKVQQAQISCTLHRQAELLRAQIHRRASPMSLDDSLSELSVGSIRQQRSSDNMSDSDSSSVNFGSSLWSSSGSWMSDTSGNLEETSDDEDEPMLTLLGREDEGSSSGGNDHWHDRYGTDTSGDADDEGGSNDENSEGEPVRSRGVLPRLGRLIREEITEMYSQRYEIPRNNLPYGPAYLPHILTVQKHQRPDHFRLALCVSPSTFDRILEQISDDPVFSNNSPNGQLPIDEQLAITLYCFGHDGNAASLQQVANWAGVSKGTVTLVTRRVMTAVLHPSFMSNAVRFPTEEEKDRAKGWVEVHSCHA